MQVRAPYMTGVYRAKGELDLSTYAPTFMMGYGPGDVKVSYYPIPDINNNSYF